MKKENKTRKRSGKKRKDKGREDHKKIVEVKDLTKEFTSYERGHGFLQAVISLVKRKKKVFRALDAISFSIEKGSVIGFLGPNGAGKSTAIKILSGVLYPDSGKADVIGYVPWKERKKYVGKIGVVFGQKSQLYWDLPPVDAFYLNKGIYRIPEKTFNDNLKLLTELLEIKDIMQRPTRQLSLGERMKCEFVMAMLHSPKIVFLDEPTIGLDVFAKEKIRGFIKEANKRFGTTFIVTSHDLEDIEHLCDRTIIINKGHIVFDDDMDKLVITRKKYISVTFEKPADIGKIRAIKGIKIKDRISDYKLNLEVNTDKAYVDEIIKKIRLGNRIEDLDISNPPITELIKKLYRR